MIFSILEIGTCEDPGERVREYRMPVSSDLGIVDYWMQVQSTRFEASRASADSGVLVRRACKMYFLDHRGVVHRC